MLNMGSLARGAVLGLISTGLLFAITGCNSKVKECNQLSDAVNATGKKIKALKDPGKDPAKIEAATAKYAAVFEQGKKDVGALHFDDAKLNGFAKEYTTLATTAATSAHSLEALLKTIVKDSKDTDKEQKAFSADLDTLKKQCATPTADCKTVGKILLKMPQSNDDKKMLAGFEGVAAGLDKVKVGKKLSKTVATFNSDIKAYAKMLGSVTAAQDKMEKLGKAQDALDKQEDALVDKVNAYCSK